MTVVSEQAKYIVEWAEEILSSILTNRNPRFPKMSSKRYMSYLPEDSGNFSEVLRDSFEPGDFVLSDTAFRDLVVETLMFKNDDSDHSDFLKFADRMQKASEIIENHEHWVRDPLNDDDLEALHSFIHDALEKLAEKNNWYDDIEEWEEDDKILAKRIFLALAYVLAWQKYTRCILFLCTMASPWICQMSEILSEAIEEPSLLKIRTELFCTRRRYNHFERLIHGYEENAGSLDTYSDISEDTSDEDVFDYDEDEDINN